MTSVLAADAVKYYDQAIAGAQCDQALYANRSAAYLALHQYAEALQDAVTAAGLNNKWPKSYYR